MAHVLSISTRRRTRGVSLLAGAATLVLGLIAPTASASTARVNYPDPLPVRGFASSHDPSMIRVADGSYYLFSTGEGVQIRHSKDRVHWEGVVGEVLPGGAAWAGDIQPDGAKDLWAPDVSYHHGMYYLYYSVSKFATNNSGIGLATSRTAKPGTWIDRGPVIRSHADDPATTDVNEASDYNAIDPGLTIDGKGRWWLSFGSFWSGIKMVQLDPSTGQLATSDPQVYSLASRPHIQYDPIEGAYIYPHGGWYYLFTSNDFCCRGLGSTYNIRVGRSRSITGPYVDKAGIDMMNDGGNQVLKTHDFVIGPGGQSVLRDRGADWLVYHYCNGRDSGVPRLGINRIMWSNGWPHV